MVNGKWEIKKMKHITTNKLQNDLSKVIKEVEAGEVYEVSRYSKPVAYLVSKTEFESMVEGQGCKSCMQDLRAIAKRMTNDPNKPINE